MIPQRGAIPIELDKPRILFFSAATTWLLVERFGVGFATELYSVTKTEGKDLAIELKSLAAFEYFLWAGLQEDALAHGETLTMHQVGDFIRPFSVPAIFSALMQALTGALYVPPAPPGNAPAAGATPPPAAAKQAGRKKTPYTAPKKASTLKTRSGSRLQR